VRFGLSHIIFHLPLVDHFFLFSMGLSLLGFILFRVKSLGMFIFVAR